jgi:hypothetical protein
VVSVLAAGPMGLAASRSGPAEGGGFSQAIKMRSSHFLRRGSKAVGVCRGFTACKRTLQSARCFVGQISRPLLLTRDSFASLPDGSGC